jgi:hypothetical protein
MYVSHKKKSQESLQNIEYTQIYFMVWNIKCKVKILCAIAGQHASQRFKIEKKKKSALNKYYLVAV